MNITEPIRHQARTRGGAVAVIRADGEPVSYAALDRMIDAVASALAEAGVVAGQVAGLAIGPPDELPGLVAALALARLGAASSDLALPTGRMDWCLAEAGRERDGVRSLPVEVVWARARALPPARAVAHPGGAAVCRIFSSSGTTGMPKFVAVSHAQMVARVQDMIVFLGGGPSVRICAVAFGITVGFQTALRTLWTGGTLVLTEAANVIASINRHRVQSLLIAPVALEGILSAMPASAPPPPSLATLEFTGSALPAPMRAAAQLRLCRTIVGWFGATETGGIASGPVAALGGDSRAVGFVHPGVVVEAVGADGTVCPAGVEGLLRVRSATVVPGYLDDAAASAEMFRDGWFYGGDVGAVSADGVLRVTGREGEVINAGGTKVSPAVIEDVLLGVPNVTDAAAFGVPSPLGTTEIWAAIVASAPVPGAALDAACQLHLGAQSPRAVLQVEALPRNANGKLLRDALVRAAVEQRAKGGR